MAAHISQMSRLAALALIAAATPAMAGAYTCALTHEGKTITVRYEIDLSEFSPALSVDEPPRRVLAEVDLDGRKLRAEAIAMQGGWTGFHAEMPHADILLTQDPEGAASLSMGNKTWRGTCEDVQ